MGSWLDQVSSLQFEAPLPLMYRVRQHWDAPALEDVEGEMRQQLALLSKRVRPGMRVGITAGSRGIAGIDRILRAVGKEVRRHGGAPFVLPGMGSHGGATAEGQAAVLAGYGVTERSVRMPIVSSMDVAEIGQLRDGDGEGPPVYFSVTALEADGLVIVNRVKPHTDFRGDIESGLAKICAIGLGKHRGARTIHSYGTRGLAYWMPRAAQFIVRRAPVLLGLAILENAYDQTARLQAIEPEEIGGAGEAALLKEARSLMASLPFDEIDVLIVDEMGKNISGTGMDTNIIGRMMIHGVPEFSAPRVRIIVVLDVADESHGNAAGIGLSDVTTRRVLEKTDLQATYINGMTASIGGVQRVKLPLFLPTDVDAVSAAILACGRGDAAGARVVRIRNTLRVAEIDVSESLLNEARANSRLTITSKGRQLAFNDQGRLLPSGTDPFDTSDISAAVPADAVSVT